jgi:hypothetical protein
MQNTSNKIKLIIFAVLALILFSPSVLANKLSCSTDSIDKFIEAENIIFIDISTHKSKKWLKNYLKAYKDPRSIQEKYKKKFLANIDVQFDNELECTFPSKIRINGDHKDHLDSAPPITSLDVELLAGNINSVIKFKLFIPHTKGGNNEVFSTALLKELGFLAPRTYHVPAVFNGLETTFLFQEKITKEFIELNDLREAPILEGDERFLFDNDIVAFDRFGLARIINNEWAEKGYTSLNISKTALTQLNKAYLEYLSGKHIYTNLNDRFLNLNTLSNENSIDKDREFKAILVAIGASHGLRPHNRSFYYDPIYRHFSPIYYDGDSTITNLSFWRNYNSPGDLKFMYFGDKLNRDEIIGSSFALKSLHKLNQKNFHSRLVGLGLNYSLEEVNVILDKVIANLENIKNTSHTPFPHKNPYMSYFSIYKDEDKKKLVFSSKRELYVEICDLLLSECQYDMLSIKDYSKLLEGRYSDDSVNSYIFIGNKQEYLTGINNQSHKKEKEFNLEDGSQLVVYGSSKTMVDKKEKRIELIQSNISDRFLIHGGKLTDWSIKFIGLTDGATNNEQRFDQNLLTGCLTLLDLSVENINIEINGALCEDAVNLVRVDGDINNVVVKNVLLDAVDADFSKIIINNINIKDAGNDCVDLSFGDYHINHIDLSDCKDKAISVGEKSKLSINSAKISKSNIGVAAKDSSVVKVNNINTNSTIMCFSAYNKKQEFWGGKITVKKHNCQENQVMQQKNSLVEFIE